jgi:hypothetical protein
MNKHEMDDLKKLVDADSKIIKENVKDSSIDTGDYVATVKTITSESFDDDKLVAKLNELWPHEGQQNPYLEIVFKPNMEAIEEGIYNGELDPACLKDCKVTKTQTRLTIKRSK